MNDSSDKFWQEVSPHLRRHLGLHERSLEEAQKIYDAAEDIPLSKEKMERIMAALSKEETGERLPEKIGRWLERIDITQSSQTPMLALNRNTGDEDVSVTKRMEEHRKEVLEKIANDTKEKVDSIPRESEEGEEGS